MYVRGYFFVCRVQSLFSSNERGVERGRFFDDGDRYCVAASPFRRLEREVKSWIVSNKITVTASHILYIDFSTY
jgi:hypothetical protein